MVMALGVLRIRKRHGSGYRLATDRLGAALALLCLVASTLGFAAPASAQAIQEANGDTLLSFPVVNGYYFSQAAGNDPAKGYTITDDGGIPFWSAFRQLGGIQGVGFPSTGRFVWNGFVDQGTQKLILQWNPAAGRVDIVNVFDVLGDRGFDPWLLAARQTPPVFDNRADAGVPWAQVVARHQAELDWNPAIKARYFADPDPLAHFGLPQSYADEGNVLVVRCQRAVFQQWKVTVPWAQAGEVTIANGGDIAKEVGLLPAGAATPIAAASVLIAPYGRPLSLTLTQVDAARAAAQVVLPSLALVVVLTTAGGAAYGSGVVIDANGLILTDAHVVEDAARVRVRLADGRQLPAQVVGVDTPADVAVLRVGASDLHPAARAAGVDLAPDTLLGAVGFTDYFPTPPQVRLGRVIAEQREQVGSESVTRVVDDLFTVFGDSGGPVFNMQGQVVGLVEGGAVSRIAGQAVKVGVETGIDTAIGAANRILSTT